MPAPRCARSAATTRRSEAFDRALALRPYYFKAHNNRGAVLEAQNRLPEALAAYERALATSPGFIEARNNCGRVLCLLARFDDALQPFTRALAQNPSDADAYYNRGRIFVDLNRNAEALADFRASAGAPAGSCRGALRRLFCRTADPVCRRIRDRPAPRGL